MSSPTTHPISLSAKPYIPPDYFRRLSVAEIFPDHPEAALEIDLGCGDGSFLVDLAAAYPERNFLGIEKLLGRTRKVARKAFRRGLTNVQALRIESLYAVRYLLPLEGVARIHLLFPDPWPKKKHYKNRLVKSALCADIHRLLRPDGEWLFATDHEEYFEDAVAIIRDSGLFQEREWTPETFYYPQTDFERLWVSEGRNIQRVRFQKKLSECIQWS